MSLRTNLRVGFDFDNTLVSYDRVFGGIARERNLIPESCATDKNAVRDHLRAVGRESEWTRLQGEVYGSRILDAEPYDGMLDALHRLGRSNVPMCIISHKTRTPYLGEAHDLHAAGRRWLDHHGFHDASGLGWSRDRVFFETTREAKVARIIAEQCTHYVDDLSEILDLLPDDVEKIHFSPLVALDRTTPWRVMREWRELPSLIGPRAIS